jgi:hypothetical protein
MSFLFLGEAALAQHLTETGGSLRGLPPLEKVFD